MKQGALVLALLLVAAAHHARAEEPPEEALTVEEAVFPELGAWREPAEDEVTQLPWLAAGPDEAAERLMQRIRRAPLRVAAVAYGFERLPAALANLRTGTSPILDARDRGAVAALARDGSLTLLRSASAAGPVGSVLRARDLEQTGAVLRRNLESAIGAVVSTPRASFVRTGLRLSAVLEPTAAEGLTLRYDVTLAEAPILETHSSLGGTLDRVSVPALLARGTVRLVPGQAAAVLRVAPDGSGRLMLLSLEGAPPEVAPVTDLGAGYVAALAGHLAAAEARSDVDLLGAHGYGDEGEEGATYADAWDPFAEAAGVDSGDVVWEQGPLGLRFGVVAAADRPRVATLLERGASLRGTRSRIDVAREGWGHLSLPASPGTAFRFFAGTVGTARGGTEVQAGCNQCVLAAPQTEWDGTGLKGAGWACVDGTVDIALVGREILDVEQRPYELRRIEDGYRSYARDPFTLPLVRERILACRCALPPNASQLPGGARLQYHLDAALPEEGGSALHVGDAVPAGALPLGGGGCIVWEAPPSETLAALTPLRLRIGGEPVPIRPGAEVRFALMTHHPFVRRWDSAGWCGMRVRYPLRDKPDLVEPGVREGTALRLRARHRNGDLLLDVAGEIRGAPEDQGLFDPGDGTVRIVRSPRLRFDLRALPLGRGGRLAEGGGLVLEIDRQGAEAAPGSHQLLAFEAEGIGTASLRTGSGAEGLLDAGADWLVPAAFDVYHSSHQTAQVSTAFTTWKDGVVLKLEGARRHPRVDCRVRFRPTFEPLSLLVDVEPERPEGRMRLLCLRRRSTERVLYLDGEGRLEFRSPDPDLRYAVSARVVSTGGEK